MQGFPVGLNKLRNEPGNTVFFRQPSFCRKIQTVQCIRKSGVPSCKGGIVIQLVIDIPAKDTVTKTGGRGGDGLEFVQTDVFAPDYPVDVGNTQLDPAYPFLTVICNQILCQTHKLSTPVP